MARFVGLTTNAIIIVGLLMILVGCSGDRINHYRKWCEFEKKFCGP